MKNNTLKILGSTIMEIILRDFLMLYQVFFSSQVKRSAIVASKQVVCELPNGLRL